MYRSRPGPTKKPKPSRELGRPKGSQDAAHARMFPVGQQVPTDGYSRYRASRLEHLERPREGEITEVRAPADDESSFCSGAAPETPEDQTPVTREVVDRLQTENFNLRQQLKIFKEASERWECPESYKVELMRFSTPIEASASGERPSPGNASFFRSIARLEKDGEVEWETEHLDRTQAIRSCWIHAMDEQKKEYERRLAQQRATFRRKTEADAAEATDDPGE